VVNKVIYAIGDIHGCLDQLRGVLNIITADAENFGAVQPRLVLLGDYVDRGLDSNATLLKPNRPAAWPLIHSVQSGNRPMSMRT
jgi:serine/threonine protein phosphatase 1